MFRNPVRNRTNADFHFLPLVFIAYDLTIHFDLEKSKFFQVPNTTQCSFTVEVSHDLESVKNNYNGFAANRDIISTPQTLGKSCAIRNALDRCPTSNV